MKIIKLTKNEIALVDDKDFEMVSKYSWCTRYTNKNKYAKTSIHLSYKKQKWIEMHTLIMNTPIGMQVDHKDGNGLNNQRENLRLCTSAENSRNSKMRDDNTSGYKGVTWNKNTKKWQACISSNPLLYLGNFSNKESAAKAYNQKAIELFGEFAKLNIIK